MKQQGRLIGSWYRFKDWGAPDPDNEKLEEAMHCARYSLPRLTQSEAYTILAAAEAYLHFAGHPAATKNIVEQLRDLRRAVKSTRKGKEVTP